MLCYDHVSFPDPILAFKACACVGGHPKYHLSDELMAMVIGKIHDMPRAQLYAVGELGIDLEKGKQRSWW